MKVIVVGGGWAGLAAAIELARQGSAPTLLEGARQLGGRARAVRFGPFHVDNGQHVLLGAFQSVLATLAAIGVAEGTVFRRQPLTLTLLDQRRRQVELRASRRLPAPLHLAAGLLNARGLSWHSRLAVVRLLRRARRDRFRLAQDVSVARLLEMARQPPEAVWNLWRPFCLATLNAPPALASARLFLNVLREGVFGGRHHADLLLPILDLSACLPEPATDYIEHRGGSVQLGARVHGLEIRDGAVTGVVLRDRVLAADQVILATPPAVSAKLLRGHVALAPHVERLRQLRTHPICTVYLRYPEHVALERDFVGLLDSTVQWLFDRGRLMGDHGLIAAVICGPGGHVRLTNADLIERVVRELAERFPPWPAPLETKLIRERQATLAAVPGVDRLRPPHATAVRGLWLAGDYTASAYPSNLEGAVRSGIVCARWALRHASSQTRPQRQPVAPIP